MMSDVCKHCDEAPCQEACPTGAHRLQRVRQRLRPAGHLQRLRLLRRRLPVRRASAATPKRRPRPQVHALLRPAEGRPDAGLRQSLSDRVDPVRPGRASCGERAAQRVEELHARGETDAYLYGAESVGEYGPLQRVLPAGRSPERLQPAGGAAPARRAPRDELPGQLWRVHRSPPWQSALVFGGRPDWRRRPPCKHERRPPDLTSGGGRAGRSFARYRTSRLRRPADVEAPVWRLPIANFLFRASTPAPCSASPRSWPATIGTERSSPRPATSRSRAAPARRSSSPIPGARTFPPHAPRVFNHPRR